MGLAWGEEEVNKKKEQRKKGNESQARPKKKTVFGLNGAKSADSAGFVFPKKERDAWLADPIFLPNACSRCCKHKWVCVSVCLCVCVSV